MVEEEEEEEEEDEEERDFVFPDFVFPDFVFPEFVFSGFFLPIGGSPGRLFALEAVVELCDVVCISCACCNLAATRGFTTD